MMIPTTGQLDNGRMQHVAGFEVPVSGYIEPTFDNELEPFTDTGNGQRLAVNHQRHLRYVPQWGWLRLEDGVWRRDDDKVMVTEAAKQTLRGMAEKHLTIGTGTKTEIATHGDWFKHVKYSFNHVEQMVHSARSVTGIQAKIGDFDTDPMLLNCRNGVVDLSDGRLLTHAEADQMFTKQAPVEYDPRKDAPKWRQFLRDVFQGDDDLIHWIQKALGYSMTGDTREQVFFICYGGGRNGKSTLRELVSAVLGDYARPLKADALMDNPYRNGSGADPELAGLVGARFVTAAEPRERGRDKAPVLDTGRVKELTGGDTLQVRELHKMPFDFHPQFKLWLSVNNRPEIPESTVGMWRRIRLIPFNARFEGARENKNLKQELLDKEAAGILNWLVEGCLLWQHEGLGEPPAAIRDATSEYHEHEDEYQPFFEKVLVRDDSPDAYVLLQEAHEAFNAWRVTANIAYLSDKAFARVAEVHTLTKKKLTAGQHKGKQALFGCHWSEGSEAKSLFCTNSPIEPSIERFVQNSKLSSPASPATITLTVDPPGEVINEQQVLPRFVPVLTPASYTAKVALERLRTDRAEWLALGDTDEARHWALAAHDPATWVGAWHLLWPDQPPPDCLPATPIELGSPDHEGEIHSYYRYWYGPDVEDKCILLVAASCEAQGIQAPHGFAQDLADFRAGLDISWGAKQERARQAAAAKWQVECEGADPTTWIGAWHLLPLCPNPHHKHGDLVYACFKSSLPVNYRVPNDLPDTPIFLRRAKDGTVTGYGLPAGVYPGGTLNERFLPAVVAASCKARGIPVSAELAAALMDLHERYERELRKVTCPHTETYTKHQPLIHRTLTICRACGDKLDEVYDYGVAV